MLVNNLLFGVIKHGLLKTKTSEMTLIQVSKLYIDNLSLATGFTSSILFSSMILSCAIFGSPEIMSSFAVWLVIVQL